MNTFELTAIVMVAFFLALAACVASMGTRDCSPWELTGKVYRGKLVSTHTCVETRYVSMEEFRLLTR